MWRDSRLQKMLSFVLLPVLVAQLSGCAEWMSYQEPPGQVLTRKSPEKVRVTLADGTRREVHSPRVANDTLVGYRSAPGGTMPSTDQVVRIPVSEIEHMEVGQTNTGGTVLLVALGVATVAVVVAAASMDLGPSSDCLFDCGGNE